MEIPNGGGKVVVDSGSVLGLGNGQWELVSPRTQRRHVWSDPAYVKRTTESRSKKDDIRTGWRCIEWVSLT